MSMPITMPINDPPPDAVDDVNQDEKLFAKALDCFTDPMFVKDRRHRWIGGNRAFFALLGRSREEVLYRSDPDFFPPEQVEVFWRNDDLLFTTGLPSDNEEQLTNREGIERTIWTRKSPVRDDDGKVIALSGTITDITAIRTRLERAFRLEAAFSEQQRVIASQEALLSKLAVPVIQIWEGILLLPMVGELTLQRTAQVLENLLQAVTQHRTRYAIIDITGVPVVDATIASYLIKAAQAVRLLGCQSVTVGIGAAVAAQLVALGVDFSALTTQATLQQGLLYAMQQLEAQRDPRQHLRKPR